MKLVSSAKLTRTRQLSEQAKAYSVKINDVLGEIANRVNKIQDGGNTAKAFLQNDNPKTVDIVLVTADKGLCGGFNMMSIKAVRSLMEEYAAKNITVRLRISGRKGVDYFSFQNVEILQSITDLSAAPDYDKASNFIKDVVEDFTLGKTD